MSTEKKGFSGSGGIDANGGPQKSDKFRVNQAVRTGAEPEYC